MSSSVPKLEQEFWRRPPAVSPPSAPIHAETCPRCHTEFVVGSRFCHVCSAERQPPENGDGCDRRPFMDFRAIRGALGLTTGALLAFLAGIICLGFAAATGLVYSTATFVDWQAVQIWRIEWLLVAVAAFLAGLLLKRTG